MQQRILEEQFENTIKDEQNNEKQYGEKSKTDAHLTPFFSIV